MRPPLRDAVLAGLIFVTGQYQVWFGSLDGPALANAAVVALISVPLAWRRIRPVAVFAVVLVAAVLQVKVSRGTWVVPTDEGLVQSWFAMLIACYSVAAHARPRPAAIAGVVGGVGIVANDLPQLLTGVTTVDHTVPAWVILAGVWGLGFALAGRRTQVEVLELEAAGAAERERQRIARELHDVVAHSLSVMVVQAQAAERVLEAEEPSAREALASIDATGRQALDEMRRLIGMLREDATGVPAPQPGLDELDLLVAQVRHAGVAVDLHVEGVRRQLAPGIELAAYRIVQEALTNVIKHAGPASAHVRVRFHPHEIELDIEDDGTGTGTGAPGGHGLAGMRERVAVYSGVLEAGTVNGSGFRVQARLPA